MKRLVLVVSAIAACAGCTKQVRPAVPVTVKIPVAVSCKVTLPKAPAWAVDALPLGAAIWDQMAALRGERLQRKGYEGELLAAIQACQ
jgi:hypothetical protein